MAKPLTAIIIMVQSLVGALICILRTMRKEIPILALVVTRTRPYCDYSIWVGTRYGNNFRPDELEVYYEVLA